MPLHRITGTAESESEDVYATTRLRPVSAPLRARTRVSLGRGPPGLHRCVGVVRPSASGRCAWFSSCFRRAWQRRSAAVKSLRSGRGAAMESLAMFAPVRITFPPASGIAVVSQSSDGLV